MTTPINLLSVEDTLDDVELIRIELERHDFAPTIERVETPEGMERALTERTWAAIFCDFSMPRFDAHGALAVRQRLAPDVPFIIVSGSVGEDAAVAVMKAGANDYILKHAMARLVPALQRELRDAETRRARRRAEEERAALVLELREAVRIRDEFLSIASHELKTPLTSLQLQVQSLQRIVEHGDVRIATKVNAAARQIDRLGRLIADLLNVSRITRGTLTLHLEEVELGAVVRDVCGRFADTLKSATCALTVNAPEPVMCRCDLARIEEVISTLVANAAKYGAGTPIDVKLLRVGEAALLSVHDEGVGIAPSVQSRIFERFEDVVTQHHGGGFGWGLSIARQIVEAHGGSIRVESEQGRGSTFLVQLPAMT